MSKAAVPALARASVHAAAVRNALDQESARHGDFAPIQLVICARAGRARAVCHYQSNEQMLASNMLMT